MMTIKLITRYNDERIEQIVIDGLEQEIVHRIMSLQEEHIRKALIDLGWTPPRTKGETVDGKEEDKS